MRFGQIDDRNARADGRVARAALQRAVLRLPVVPRRDRARAGQGPAGADARAARRPREVPRPARRLRRHDARLQPGAVRGRDREGHGDVELGRGASPEGRAKGFGFYYSHLGYFAEVVEASLGARKRSRSTTSGPRATSAATSSTRSARSTRSKARSSTGSARRSRWRSRSRTAAPSSRTSTTTRCRACR